MSFTYLKRSRVSFIIQAEDATVKYKIITFLVKQEITKEIMFAMEFLGKYMANLYIYIQMTKLNGYNNSYHRI